MATSKAARLYFAYGSNLSLTQMKSRCPSSTYHSFGFLPNYKWIIGERGYANVVRTAPEEQCEVFGMLYTLEISDEENLDIAEGVPYAYYKRELAIIVATKDDEGKNLDLKEVTALVYVDERRLGEGVCKEEYVHRMNRGIRDAKSKGMQDAWVKRYIRPFVREEDVPDDREVEDPFHPSKSEESYEEEGY